MPTQYCLWNPLSVWFGFDEQKHKTVLFSFSSVGENVFSSFSDAPEFFPTPSTACQFSQATLFLSFSEADANRVAVFPQLIQAVDAHSGSLGAPEGREQQTFLQAQSSGARCCWTQHTYFSSSLRAPHIHHTQV